MLQVSYGVDADRDAAASFMLNTADGVEGPFNPQGFGPTDTHHCTVGLLALLTMGVSRTVRLAWIFM